jgi:hypothetical protein
MEGIAVAWDIASGQLTPEVVDLALDRLADQLREKLDEKDQEKSRADAPETT